MKKKKSIPSNFKLQNGGTLFTIKSNDLDLLWHVGTSEVEETCCAACSANQLNFPIELINEMVNFNKAGGLMSPKKVNEIINKVKDTYGDDYFSKSNPYSWGVKWKKDIPEVSVVPYNGSLLFQEIRRPGPYEQYTFRGEDSHIMFLALLQIFDSIPRGTATFLAIHWGNEEGRIKSGHIVVIAKSNDGKPYLIECQASGGSQGVYRTYQNIFKYFDETSENVVRLITFNNSHPYYDKENNIWRVDENYEEILTLPERNASIIPNDATEGTRPSFERTGSYIGPLPPPYLSPEVLIKKYNQGVKKTARTELNNSVLAAGWNMTKDPISGLIYYYNINTMESQWMPPISNSGGQKKQRDPKTYKLKYFARRGKTKKKKIKCKVTRKKKFKIKSI